MNSEAIIALVSLAGTIIGTFSGIIVSNKLVNYRIEQLEKKVDKHNCLVERMTIQEEKMKVANHRIDDLETLTKEIA